MVISALCWLTMCFTIAKPKPVPPTSLLLAGSTLKNLSVTCGIFSFDMPIPWSLIVTKKFLFSDLILDVLLNSLSSIGNKYLRDNNESFTFPTWHNSLADCG